MPTLKAAELNAHIRENNATWQARDTPHAQLPDEVKRRMLGVIVNESDRAAAMAAPRMASAAPPAFDPLVDWRNRNGNHVTPVKDQGQCGSCVSFCTVSVTESMASIEKGQLLDLSEADLHFCSSHGANCNGWWPQDAYGQLASRGTPDEACFPYASAFVPGPGPACKTCSDRNQRAVKITSSSTLAAIVDRKNYISAKGPVSAVMHVFDDFFSYGNGVYKHVTGVEVGLHCITVIGYSETEQCWICKNSWGPGWGNAGFFKIAYGQCGIDSDFPFWTASGVVLPATSGWSGWESLGGQITSTPRAVSWGANRIDAVARGLDSAVWHRWWNGSAWLGWESLGGQIQGGPAICSWASGRLDIFAVGLNHHCYHRYYAGSWSGWEDLGGVLSSDPACVSWGNGRIDIFARGLDSAMWHFYFDGSWHGWENLGGVITGPPTVASWGVNRLDAFARGTDSHLWHRYWNGSAWSAWENLGGYVGGDPGAESWGANRIDIFYPGQTSHMMHKWWNGSAWSGEEDLGGTLSSGVGVASWASGRLDTFVEGTDSAMWHKWYA
jgi:C1A family cysteine protease